MKPAAADQRRQGKASASFVSVHYLFLQGFYFDHIRCSDIIVSGLTAGRRRMRNV